MTPAYLRTLSATSLARLIREGRVSSRQVVDAHIARIETVNPRINAMVMPRFEQARAEAELADEAVRRGGGLGPLHGVPCTIKESFALEGMPHTAGLVARQGVRATKDAPTVARLRDAGAIPIGVTNISELCMWMESNNRVYGRSNNPYDASRIVGGSSGGEGAVIGAGASPFGLGSDVGGSIRMPAFFNGVFGHKPSSGLVPNTGQYPATDSPQGLRFLSTGPLARRAEDLPLLLSLLAGPDGECAGCEPMALRDPEAVDIASLRVLDMRGDGFTRVQQRLRSAQRRVSEHLRSLGCDVGKLRLPKLRHGLEIWSAMMEEGNEQTFGTLLGNGEEIDFWPAMLRFLVGRSPHTLPALGLVAAERVVKRLGDRSEQVIALAGELRAELEDRLGDDGVMLYPSYASVAPKHGAPLMPPTRWVYTALLNVMEMPSTQVPLGLDHEGLPLGIQVAAKRGNDHLTLAVARELERRFGGWIPPRF